MTITLPNMKRPVFWKCNNYKYECDRTCADGPYYKVAHVENTSTLFIKDVTKNCLTWEFDDDNQNAADIHLKIKGLTNTYPDDSTQNGIAVLNGNVTMTITIPKMKRPVTWECHKYKNECDRTCLNGHFYKVTHIVNSSHLSITDGTKGCMTQKFPNANLKAADIHLKINNPKRGLSTPELVRKILGAFIFNAIVVGVLFFGHKYLQNYLSV
ncbi:uncharacterized protein LOC115225442 [Octopus sinensis]|uniref:Uncharacterized protein LOC115225442 n=1 Tax=Octopus sinensis TaxID=2607531 RepID=A0A6P7TSD5_9MOLL|nr:uncharacterized protein LOC115225442 [Octopus sinensis]